MNKLLSRQAKFQIRRQHRVHNLPNHRRILNRDAISRKEPLLMRLHEYIWKTIKYANDESEIDGNSDSFYLQSTLSPERFVCIYLIADAPMALLLIKHHYRNGKFSQNRAHDQLFVRFQIIHQRAMVQVVKKWMLGEPLGKVQEYITSNQKYFSDLEILSNN